jgi:ATP-dependent DNA ligase
MRSLPLSIRKANLERLLARRPEGIFVAPFKQGEIGPDLFRAACNMGLEGLVSKRRDRPYRAGRSPHWIKVKNQTHPAMSRVKDSFARASRHLLHSRSGLGAKRMEMVSQPRHPSGSWPSDDEGGGDF